MQVTFERADVADAPTLVAVQIAAFHYDSVLYPDVELGGPPGYDSADAMRQKIQDDVCYTIMHAGEIIGWIVIVDQGAEQMHLDLIFIDPAYHSRGIGTRALAFIEQAHPAHLWTLDTPTWALRNQHFYEKLGYVRVGEHALPDITLIAYEKRLG
jgi:GNAT superfamily N-acetyltransferase